MPVFDSSTSKPSRAEAELLHGVLGPANPRPTFLQQASRAYRRRQTRAKIARAFVAVALLGGVRDQRKWPSPTSSGSDVACPI
jgi:hypothetical protein